MTILTLSQRPAFLPENFYKKLKEDSLNTDEKNEFLLLCEPCDCETKTAEAEGRSIEMVYNEFVGHRQDSGISIVLKEGEILGRVTNLRDAARYISKGLNQSIPDVLQMFFWLDSLSEQKPKPSQLEVAKEWLEDLKKAVDPDSDSPFAISPQICWLFRSDLGGFDANEDFDQDGECLACRLGLPSLLNDDQIYEIGLDYLCFTVHAEHVKKPRASNFCHAGYLVVRDIWKPGGTTAPIPYGPEPCVKKGGLPEVICDPVGYQHVPGPIRIVRT